MLQWSSHSQNLFCQIFWQEFEAEMKLSGLSWRSCEGSKRVIGPLQAGRSTRYPATIETPEQAIKTRKKKFGTLSM